MWASNCDQALSGLDPPRSCADPLPRARAARCYLPEDQQRLQEAITTGFGEATAFNACVRNLLRSSLGAPVINNSPSRAQLSSDGKRGSGRGFRSNIARCGTASRSTKTVLSEVLSGGASRRSMVSSRSSSPPVTRSPADPAPAVSEDVRLNAEVEP